MPSIVSHWEYVIKSNICWMNKGKDRWREGLRERWRKGWRDDAQMQLTFLREDICSQLLMGQPVRCDPKSIWLFSIPVIAQGWILMEAPPRCLKPKGEIPYSLSSGNQTVHIIYCERTAGLYNAHPPFFYYILSWSNCKPTRECLAIINSCSWKRTRSHNCTFYDVHPGHCSTSVAMHVFCSWKHHKIGSWLKSEQEGTRRGGRKIQKTIYLL